MISIIDSHTHFWDPSCFDYPWLERLPNINKAFLPSDYLNDTVNIMIEGCVFVQCDTITSQIKDEVHFVQTLARDFPVIKGIVAAAPIESGDAIRPYLEELKEIPLVKGVRRLLQDETSEFALQNNFQKGLKVLADLDLPFDVCVKNNNQLSAISKLVQQNERNIFILDHFGKPNVGGGEFDLWKNNIQEIAKSENVYCKFSGLLTEMSGAQKVDVLSPYFDIVLESFGSKRILYGCDWPVCNLGGWL